MKLGDLLEWILHVDRHLGALVAAYRGGAYAILAAVIFAETGLVVTPFLPGDSLLFAAGALAADGSFGLHWLILLLGAAAVGGDAVNYAVGAATRQRVVGPRRWIRPEHLERTRRFYDRYGAKTIVLARFVPIVRTFAPFLAGASGMQYRRFAVYNVFGGVLWVATMTGAGYLFGNLPVVEEHFSLVVLAIIAISLIPAVVGWSRERRHAGPTA